MRTETRHVRLVLDREDCQMLAQAVQVFARQLLDDCHRDMGAKDVPPEVASRLEGLKATAATLAEAHGLDCSWEGMVKARSRGERFWAFDLSPAEWRAVGAATFFVAEKVRPGDRVNGERLGELSSKANGIAGWCEPWLQKLEQAEAEL